MAETIIAPIAAPSTWSQTGSALVFTALDNANGNKFLVAPGTIVIVQNTDSGSHNVQFTSAADSFGRVGDINQAIAAGAFQVFDFTTSGWSNAGYVFMPSGQNANLKIAILATN